MFDEKKKSILIIDDHPNNLKLISTLLDGKYNVIIANSGLKGLKTIEKKVPDLILLDINMPEMNGFQVCDILKKDANTKNIPIIFLTANTDFESIAKGFDVGAIDYITKPFNSKEVLVRINTHIQLSESIITIKSQNEALLKAKDALDKKNQELISALFSLEERTKNISELNQRLKKSEHHLKATVEKLEQSNSEKDKLFSIIAHDLRSPFQGFLGITKIFVEDNTDAFSKEELNEIFLSMNQNAQKLYELLENLLEWASLKRNVTRFKPRSLNVSDTIINNAEIFQLNAKEKNISISIASIDNGLEIFADEEMVNSILRNLLSNALKFTIRSGKIEVLAEKTESGQVKIGIKDSGIGIPEKNIPFLFNFDKKVNRIGTEGEPSSGLGLVLCKDFMEKNGGQIEVESEVGKGTTFSLIFPPV